MVVRFRKKVIKKRGSRTYGYGSSKKHRGKGSKGGKGLAGSGKKGQHKKIKLMMAGRTIGKRGFKMPYSHKPEAITTKSLLENIEYFMKKYGKESSDDSKSIELLFGDDIKIIHQKSFEAIEEKHKDYKIKIVVSKITPKAKEYLEGKGVVVEIPTQEQ